jgi:hypothetical protein
MAGLGVQLEQPGVLLLCRLRSRQTTASGVAMFGHIEPFSSCFCFADLQNVDGLGECEGFV